MSIIFLTILILLVIFNVRKVKSEKQLAK